tara:strand:- start:26 stop:163 length:138 start_codon:yes stop_codon:yes gene_type:complete
MKWLILSPLCEVGDCLPGWLESELDTGRNIAESAAASPGKLNSNE